MIFFLEKNQILPINIFKQLKNTLPHIQKGIAKKQISFCESQIVLTIVPIF